MRIKIAILILSIMMAPYGAMAANSCTTTPTDICESYSENASACSEQEGCYYVDTGPACLVTNTGSYNDGTGVQTCPAGYTTETAGATAKTCCYKKSCDKQPDIENGTAINQKQFLGSDKCTYNIQCNTDPDNCKGYHLNAENKCVSNKIPLAGASGLPEGLREGFALWENKTTTSTHATSCESTYVLTDQRQLCGETVGTCKPLRCSAYVTEGLASCGNIDRYGTVSGNVEHNSSTNSLDFSKCICSYPKDDFQNGTADQECNYITNGSSINNATCKINVKTCDIGYCTPMVKLVQESQSCQPAPLGYYSSNTATDCGTCPVGKTTSVTGATHPSQCKYTSATRFCDNYGCFNLNGGITFTTMALD